MGRKKVAVGMSGGVDSSVAAYLLQKEGYEVIGITIQLWQDGEAEPESNGGCCSLSAVDDARNVANLLGIPYYVINLKQYFKEHVINYFIKEYQNGRTPNPCNACNRYVKWEAFLKKAMEIGADYISTGHYAGVERLTNGRYTLKCSKTAAKDQTYALYMLTQEQLKHTLMPVGEYTKEEIRRIAGDIGMSVANKPDSQEICFIHDNDYAGYIKRETGMEFPKGDFVDTSGNIIGRHKGIIHYTIGQRKGLSLSMGHPVFVVDIRADTNEVVIGEKEDCFGRRLIANDLHFMSIPSLEQEMEVTAKIRYAHRGAKCKISMIDEEHLECVFLEPQRAITPGQAVVFYEAGHVLGGGTII